MKKCSKCGAIKSTVDFYADKREKDGVRHACKTCICLDRKARYLANHEKELEMSQNWKSNNLEKHRKANSEWQKANGEKVSLYARKWQKANPLKVSSIKASRRSAGKCAWANSKKIQEIYEFAKEFRNAGFDVHVDHIIPLKGKDASGLHVEHNLRVCLANANLRKSNQLMENLL